METSSIRVLVHLRWRPQYGQDVISGLSSSRESPELDLALVNFDHALSKEQIAHMNPQVVVGDSTMQGTIRAARELGIPYIDVSGSSTSEKSHRVGVDEEAVGRMAADHLKRTGVGRFAYIGFTDQEYSKRRENGFREELGDVSVAVYESGLSGYVLGRLDNELVEFLKKLSYPVGIFACSDLRASVVLPAARSLGLQIPGDIFLLGVDVDVPVAAVTGYRISSIDHSAWFVGLETARLVRRIAQDVTLPDQTIVVPPLRVVERPSTSRIPVADPAIDAFLDRLEKSIVNPGGLAEALEQTTVSRRTVETRFRKRFGISPLQYYNQLRRDRALKLLADPSIKISEIARQTGFTTQSDFSRFIRKSLKVSPTAVRQRLCRGQSS